MDKKSGVVLCILTAALLLSGFIGLLCGPADIPARDVVRALLSNTTGTDVTIVRAIRLPRVIAAFLAGAALAVSGALIQCVLANPLASPGIIGVNAGAGFAVALSLTLAGRYLALIPLFAFSGALVSLLTVYGIALASGASRLTLVLSGVAVSSMLTAGVAALLLFKPDNMQAIRDFQTGGISGVTMSHLRFSGPLIVLAIAISILAGNELGVLELGLETAASLGLRTGLYRLLFLVLAALLSGAAVSFAGLLGFIGLMAPHISGRLLPGRPKRILLTASALTGALFLIASDTVSRTLFAPNEIPAGIPIAFLGAPFFLSLLFSQRRRHHD